jgi:hypothetical protein
VHPLACRWRCTCCYVISCISGVPCVTLYSCTLCFFNALFALPACLPITLFGQVAYPAELAGLQYSVTNHLAGFQVQCYKSVTQRATEFYTLRCSLHMRAHPHNSLQAVGAESVLSTPSTPAACADCTGECPGLQPEASSPAKPRSG